MKNKGMIVTVAAVAMALLVSTGIAIAAGVAGGTEERSSATRAAGDAYSFGCNNSGEGDRIRAENCAGEENGECEGDCEQEQLRERDRDCLQDGSCDGDCDGAQNQNRSNGCPMVDEAGVVNASSEAWNGNCTGDCDRDQDCLQDGSCDGDCDVTQTRNCRGTGTE